MMKGKTVLIVFTWIAIISAFLVGAFGGVWLFPREIIVHQPVVTEKLVLVNQTCPECEVCSQCNFTREVVIEKTIPCPECKCLCTSHGAYEEGKKVWWYQDNQTTGETP